MTQILEDNVDVNLQIGTTQGGVVDTIENEFEDNAIFWDVIQARVELSQVASPNFVKGHVTPQPQFKEELNALLSSPAGETDAPESVADNPLLPNNGISKLVGSHFRLEVDNDFVAVEADETTNQTRKLSQEVSEDVDEDSLLFNGRLANISPIGTNIYEFIAYDPGQQAFNIGEESGSVINQKLDFTGQEIGFRDVDDALDNNVTGDHSQPAIDVIEAIVEQANLLDRTVILEKDFRQQAQIGPNPLETQIRVDFNKLVVTVEKALNNIREQTNTEWWFDKDGTLYFGDPGNDSLGRAGSRVYESELITDTSAGITTPPYQSVRVIGRGVASSDGYEANNNIQDEDQKLIVTANIAQPDAGGAQANLVIELNPDTLQKPVFKYVNAEIGTVEQAENTALKIANELIKQQASGKVTVVGMAEVTPFDGILMPNDKDQPMGGQLYDVYSVVHKLNPSDGFTTEIEVAGPNPTIRAEADVSEAGQSNIIPTSLDREVYKEGVGIRRKYKSGAGKGGRAERPGDIF